MVPVLFMPAVMAAEQVGAGREELEDFDEAADGEPVPTWDARALVEGDSSAISHHKFFGGCTSGGPIGDARATGALPSQPRHVPPRDAGC
jgi:hypothetical protein